MKLKGIMSIAGYHGLFKLVSQAKNSVIVESLIEGKRMPAFNSYKISALEDIAIFTEDKELPLTEIFKTMLEKFDKKPTIDTKLANNELIKTFSDIVPNYDKNRVYVSDIKKVYSWYNLLLSKDLLKDEPEVKEETSNNEVENTDSEKKVAKPKANKTVKPKETKTVKATSKSKSQAKTPTVRKSSSSSSK